MFPLFKGIPNQDTNTTNAVKTDDSGGGGTRPGSIVRIPEPVPPPNSPASYSTNSQIPHTHGFQRCHSRNSSLDMRVSVTSRSSNDLRNYGNTRNGISSNGHSRAASLDLRHKRNSSADLNKLIKNDVNLMFGCSSSEYFLVH